MQQRKFYPWLFLCLFPFAGTATLADPNVFDEWVPPAGDAVIAITRQDELATLILRDTLESDLRDKHNDDRALRNRLLKGIVLGEGFHYTDEWWRGATLYDPDTGKTYRARFQLQGPNHLVLRGYIGAPAFGRSMILIRKTVFQQNMLRLLNIDRQCSQGGQNE